jgi:MoaA/NifB/PqqE/SkfB family radical SAM enzyme
MEETMLRNDLRPERVYFEVTNYCNFDCAFCPSGRLARPREHMDLDLFKKGIDDIVQDRVTDRIGFHVLGEPLMYPHIYEAISYAHAQGLHTELSTNGSLLTPARIDGLAAAGLDMLGISAQMLDEESHAARGTSLSFDSYYARILDAVARIHASAPQMEVMLCYMNTSTRRLFDIDREMHLNWQEDRGRLRLLFFVLDLYGALGQRVSREEVALAIEKLDVLRPKLLRLDAHTVVYVQPMMDWGNAFTERKVYPARFGYCGYGLSNVGILSNGQVTICCGDYEGHTALGNLSEQSLGKMLASEAAATVREGLRRNSLVHPYCQRCLGSTNPLKAIAKGVGSVYLFRLLNFHPARARELALPAAA